MEQADLTYSWRSTDLLGEGRVMAFLEGIHLEGVVQRGGSLVPDISSDLYIGQTYVSPFQ